MTDLHVAINAVFLEPSFGGMERYARNLPGALLRLRDDLRLTIFANPRGAQLLRSEPWAGSAEILTPRVLRLHGSKAAFELAALGPLAARRGVDLVHSLAMTGPLWCSAAHVVTLPDVTWIVEPDENDSRTVRLWRAVVPLVARRADRVLAISQAAADDVVRYLRVPARRVDVALLGASSRPAAEPAPAGELRRRFGLGERTVVLAVSAKRPHKNLLRLVEAVARLDEVALVVPGEPTPYEAELRSLAHRLGVADRVRFPPYVSDGELEGLYALAACVAFSSLNEGFGLPVLEGMSRGVPVACARAGALPEVGGDVVAYFDPHSVEDMAETLRGVLTDKVAAAERVRRALERARTFTWQRTASRTLDSYEQALAHRGHRRGTFSRLA